MFERLHLYALRVFERLPRQLRRVVVRAGSPKYTVGAICAVQRDDGRVLLVRHSYRQGWGIPGGLAKRRESPEDAAVRETLEEVGLHIELNGEPVVVVAPRWRRVDIVFAARPRSERDADAAIPSSPEIELAEWFSIDALPDLQPETVDALAALGRGGRMDVGSIVDSGA